jgi:transposase-like protein
MECTSTHLEKNDIGRENREKYPCGDCITELQMPILHP